MSQHFESGERVSGFYNKGHVGLRRYDRDMSYSVNVMHFALLSAAEDSNLFEKLIINPAQELAKFGFPINSDQLIYFNEYAREKILPLKKHLDAGNKIEEFTGFWCTTCEISAWTIAAAIVSIGVGGLSTLTAGSSVVVSLAAFAGVTAATSLAFIIGLATFIGIGISAVAEQICTWTGACP